VVLRGVQGWGKGEEGRVRLVSSDGCGGEEVAGEGWVRLVGLDQKGGFSAHAEIDHPPSTHTNPHTTTLLPQLFKKKNTHTHTQK
jgi:hypothetical protein